MSQAHNRIKFAAKTILREPRLFSTHVLQRPLYDYQLPAAEAVVNSCIHNLGDEHLLLFPRQTGKNELIAQIVVYLLNLNQFRPPTNIIFASIGDAVGRGMARIEQHLNNPWNFGRWKKGARPIKRALGNASVSFLSAHPGALSRGDTANPLLILDELQSLDTAQINAVFQPMRAAYNATALYAGTVRTTQDALWIKKVELEQMQAQDGRQRIFTPSLQSIYNANQNYQSFLAKEIRRLSAEHPILRAEYFLEPMNITGGLFPARRLELIKGTHPPETEPQAGANYIATIDLAAAHEQSPEDPTKDPTQDHTAVTIFRHTAENTYHVVNVMTDRGTPHFETNPSQPALANQLLNYLRYWNVSHIVIDASGIGEGVASYISEHYPTQTTRLRINATTKAAIGNRIIALIEQNRVKMFDDQEPEGDTFWLLTQAKYCTYHVANDRPLESALRWSVPDQMTIDTTAGRRKVHDDRLFSFALIAELDRLAEDYTIRLGQAISVVIPSPDPLTALTF